MDERSTRDEELDDLMRRASAVYNSMSLEERRKHDRAQRISWVYGEMRLDHGAERLAIAVLVGLSALLPPLAAQVLAHLLQRDLARDRLVDGDADGRRAQRSRLDEHRFHLLVRDIVSSEIWGSGTEEILFWTSGPGEPMMGRRISNVVASVARHEQRHPAAVLREIASMGAVPPTGEPMTVEEIDGLDRTEVQWQRAASGFDATTVRRLIATVRAACAERDAARRERAQAWDDHVVLSRRANEIAEAWRALAQARSKRDIPMLEGVGEELARRADAERKSLDGLRALGIDPDAP